MALGQPDPDVMLAGLSSPLVAEWQAYAALEPFGEDRADLRMATLAALIANVNRDPDKQAEPFTAADFLPHFDPFPDLDDDEDPEMDAADRQSSAEMLAMVEAMNDAFGGQDLRGQQPAAAGEAPAQ